MSTMSLPQIPGAFSAYKPSTAAHTDFLSGGSSSTDAAKDVKVIKLIPSREFPSGHLLAMTARC